MVELVMKSSKSLKAVLGVWALAMGLSWSIACVSGDAPLSVVDPDAAPRVPAYEAHIAPIMERYCTACHAADAQPGEVDGFGYETCQKVRRNWGGVIWTVFETRTMPPGGAQRVTAADELTLQRWYDQGARCD